MKKILVLGGVSLDSIIRLSELPGKLPNTIFAKNYFQSVGGTGSGKALNLNRLGFDVRLVAKLGKDESGQKITDLFNQENISFTPLLDPISTEEHTNLIDDEGTRISIYTKPGSFEVEFESFNLKEHLEWCDLVILNINNYTRQWIDLVKTFNKEIWVDIHDYDGVEDYHKDFIEVADYLFMSSDKMKQYESFCKNQLKDKHFVVITHGKDGSTFMDQKNSYHENIINTFEFIDSNGAGDSFFSGFLYGYLKGVNPQQALKYGTIVGGLSIQSKDLFNHDLTQELVEKIYTKTYL